MKNNKALYRIIFIGLLLCWGFLGEAQTIYDIGTSTGKYEFKSHEIPDNLVPIVPNVSGSSYQWEDSFFPLDGFSTIPGATAATYTFTYPLSRTTYVRRRTTINTSGGPVYYYSNIVKLEVVSKNWENHNYLREHTILEPGVTDGNVVDNLPIGRKLQTTTYLDGLGRPVQKINHETATPIPGQPDILGDVVEFYKYDVLGREPLKYLPFASISQLSLFKTNPLTEQTEYYNRGYNESFAYSSATFDKSPLNRIINSKSPGISWATGSGNFISYQLNEDADYVQMFSLDLDASNALYRVMPYSANTLHKTMYIDENLKQVIEYTDKGGQLILRKIQLADLPSTAHAGWLCVYNVYDEFGRLRYQIQPEGVKWLEANGWSFDGAGGQQVLNEFCFRYEYDEKGRVTMKKAPGAKELYMLYDKRDRVVFMQDGNQRARTPGEWTANLYDELDRPVIKAFYNTTKTISELQTAINNAVTTTTTTATVQSNAPNNLEVSVRDVSVLTYKAAKSIEFTGTFESVNNDAFETAIDPTMVTTSVTNSFTIHTDPIPVTEMNDPSKFTALRYNFYDDYNYAGVKSFNTSFKNSLAYSSGPTIEPVAMSKRTLSELTGTQVRILGTATFLNTSLYYDEKGRLIQTSEDNIKKEIDVATSQYHFDNRLLSTDVRHSASGTEFEGFSILTKYVYDRVGTLVSLQKKFGGNDFKTVATYDVDDFGRLRNKRLSPGYTGTGKNELETLAYSYNIRGEITGINKDYALKTPDKYYKWGNFFGLYLGFDNRDGVFANKRLDGKVTGLLWTTQGDNAQRKYDYSYDNAGRLTNALYNERGNVGEAWSNAKMNFSVTGRNGKIEYDLNGNLLAMLQKGVVPGNAAPVNVDDLQYSYASMSNKLLKVVDNSNLGTANGKLHDFSDGANGANDDYVYDDNGNLVIDLNKNAKDLAGLGGKGIRYNYLDKPEEIRISGKGTIKIVYDADGKKLQKIFTPESGGTSVTTTYVQEFVYKGDNLQYINFEEGRIRVMQAVNQNNGYDLLTLDGNMELPGGKRGAYDYFIRDYQENVRMILTEEIHQGSNSCTMETNRAANEEPLFGQVDANGNPTAGNEVKARFAVSSIPGQTTGQGWQNSTIGNYVSRIGNLAGKKVGPNSLLKVMAGDEVSATTIYYYKNPVTNTSGGPSLITDLILSLTLAITGSPVAPDVTKGAAGNITSLLNGSVPFKSFVAPDADNPAGNNPKAYLSVLFFDERFNFVTEGSVTARVVQAGNGAPALVLADLKAPRNGYAYVYVSNESDEMVYFDNLQVAHKRGRIVEENHYYSFGLKIAGISSQKAPDVNEGHVTNKNLYNDKELIDEADLNWYDYGFRSYDPQIGRFPQLDPLAFEYAFLTPYQYASNEPIGNVDLDGLEAAQVLEPVTVIGYRTAKSVAANAFKVQGRLLQIALRGSFDALANANSVGLYDLGDALWDGTHLDEYSDPYEKQAYLRGRIAGSVAALAQGGAQVTGGTTAAVATGWTGVGAVVGGGVALHGVGVSATATADIIKAMRQLVALNIPVSASSEISSIKYATSTPTNGETPSTTAGKEAHKQYNPGSNYTVDRKSNTLDNNKIPDAVDIKNRIVRELKPNNPRKIKEGIKQVKNYMKQLKKQYGGNWKYAIDTYDVGPNGTFKYNYGSPK